MEDVTAIIKAFKRDKYLYDCVSTLKTKYPHIRLIVVDDGEENADRERMVERYGGRYVRLPFDSGLSAGRNAAIDLVDTPYVLIGDDDFYYADDSARQLRSLMDVAEIAGGRVIQGGTLRDYQGTFNEYENGPMRCLEYRKVEHDNYSFHGTIPYKPCHLVFNYFVARTDVVRSLRWDDRLKVSYEHSDFFLNAWKKNAKVVFCPYATVIHKPMHIELTDDEKKEYLEFRHNKDGERIFLDKWGYDLIQDMNGYKTFK